MTGHDNEYSTWLKIVRAIVVGTIACIGSFAGCSGFQSYSWNSMNAALGKSCMDAGGRWVPIQAQASISNLGSGCVKP